MQDVFFLHKAVAVVARVETKMMGLAQQSSFGLFSASWLWLMVRAWVWMWVCHWVWDKTRHVFECGHGHGHGGKEHQIKKY
jgi:hypothetical protein